MSERPVQPRVPASADERAAALVEQMTLDEQIQLVGGYLGFRLKPDGSLIGDAEVPPEAIPPPGPIGSDGFVPGIERLGIPAMQLVGAGSGVTDMCRRVEGQATAFPCALAQTATWDPELTHAFGSAVGREARALGFNVFLAGAVNLAVDLRGGRSFEYHGEDPVLAGIMVAGELRGCQDEGVVASVKHFAGNFQETGRYVVDSRVEERALRQGELLAFEIAIARSRVGAVMTAYNRLNGTYCSENRYLIDEVLKGEWGFPGWVMSDWGGTHTTVKAALAGLDQEFPMRRYFGSALERAVEDGEVPKARLDDMNRRILRTLIEVGVLDRAADEGRSPDFSASAAVAQHIAERAIVLLENRSLLPLDPKRLRRVVVIGGHADVAVLSGGGSAGVNPIGGDPVNPITELEPIFGRLIWVPSSPLQAIAGRCPDAELTYLDGEDRDAAVRAAGGADVAVVFATQWTRENEDVPDLRLPGGQDELISAVTGANPRTIVVLETGTAVLVPWADQVGALLEAWYPGQRGGEAIARVLFGEVTPSGHLPITFPRSEADLPRPVLPAVPVRAGHASRSDAVNPEGPFDWVDEPFIVDYSEGLAIGYKWFDAQGIEPAYCFGHGLTYTTFELSELQLQLDHSSGSEGGVCCSFTVANTGDRPARALIQGYAALPTGNGEPPRRLVGWLGAEVAPGEARRLLLEVPGKHLAIWDVDERCWRLLPGRYRLFVGTSSRDLPLQASFELEGRKGVRSADDDR